MRLVRTALSGLAGAAIAKAVNTVAHRAVARRMPGYPVLSRLGLGGVATRRAPVTPAQQVLTTVAGLAGTALVNRLLRKRR